MDCFLWGRVSYIPSELPDPMVKEDEKTYSAPGTSKDMIDSATQDPEMGKRVRYWGFSLAKVEKRSGLPVDLIRSIEAGNHTSTDVIVKLADTLRCSIDFLLGCGSASVAHHPQLDRTSRKVQ
ncbi:hypothetical protein DSCO28_36380 [Desulfosarcina ovata subsp. sediminis]|uniref:HTH cro/C1-type domain-containing protein n=1 Tax=Desulfosarcina ovata subsp. sediminis TaxID=885957 RepID=A0A5K7ZS92_9BACT|nr:helix-turn-helix domain-containing protein [Desulfosarcina ovata]BBO83072.1 hypothetical protein DSCO28_36380 [Desulfosarcina ovata subsp. sediminis]